MYYLLFVPALGATRSVSRPRVLVTWGIISSQTFYQNNDHNSPCNNSQSQGNIKSLSSIYPRGSPIMFDLPTINSAWFCCPRQVTIPPGTCVSTCHKRQWDHVSANKRPALHLLCILCRFCTEDCTQEHDSFAASVSHILRIRTWRYF